MLLASRSAAATVAAADPTPARFAWAGAPAGAGLPVYHGPAYQRLFAAHDGCEARWLACTRPGSRLLLPLLVRTLPGGCREAYSAYGYGGWCSDDPARTEADSPPLDAADLAALQRMLAAEGIAALFLRHAPFLDNQGLWPATAHALNRHTYAAMLRPAEGRDTRLAALPQKLRWSVQRARRAGLAVRFTPLDVLPAARLAAFHRLYDGLMAGKGSDGYYRFPEALFHAHARALGARGEFAEIADPTSGALLAGALFLADDRGWVHYHLSAAHREAMRLQAMELLLAEALHHYGNRGLKALHLGGGHALDESDGLSRFKARFADRRLAFHTTRLVCDDAAYQRERARRPLAHPQRFLVADARGEPLAA